jgi:hypothetical protein
VTNHFDADNSDSQFEPNKAPAPFDPTVGDGGDHEWMESDLLKSVESTILSAGRYVVPSDDLRPRTLEAARHCFSDRKNMRRLIRMTALAAACVCLTAPVAELVGVFRGAFNQSTQEAIEQRSIDIAAQKQISLQWGMLEAFSELRSLQATQLGHAPSGRGSE